MGALLGWLALALVFSLVSANPDPPDLADVDCLAAALAVKVVCSHHFSHTTTCVLQADVRFAAMAMHR